MGETLTLSSSDSLEDGPREFEPIPEDTILEAEIVSFKKAIKPWKDDAGNEVIRYEFGFKITEPGQFENRKIWGDTPTTFSTHPDCRLRQWVQEILRLPDLNAGTSLDGDDLVGQTVRVAIAQGKPREKDGRTVIRNWVKDVLRPRTAVLNAAPVAPAPEPNWEEPF